MRTSCAFVTSRDYYGITRLNTTSQSKTLFRKQNKEEILSMGITLINKENTGPRTRYQLVLKPYLLRGHYFPGTQVSSSTEHGYKEFLEQKAADARLCAEAKNSWIINATSGCCPCPQKFTSLYKLATQKALYILWLGVHVQQSKPCFKSLF